MAAKTHPERMNKTWKAVRRKPIRIHLRGFKKPSGRSGGAAGRWLFPQNENGGSCLTCGAILLGLSLI
jgi:hypothetical protein